jgi:transcription initiation factor TFIIE subunit alpha
MEVLDKHDFEKGFLCHKCGYPLIRNADTDRGGHVQSTRLNAQFRFITDLLPKIDQVVVPDNTFETALASARPVFRDQLNPTNPSASIQSDISKPTAVKGINTGPTTIAVTLTTSDGPTAADKAAEQARRDAVLAQNQLPAHFTHSTVTGEQILPATNASFKSSQPEDTKDKKDPTMATTSAANSAEEDSYWDSYAALLKAEQAREALKQQEAEPESDEEEEEDEVDFEDVVPAAGSGVGTPASSASVNGGETKAIPGVLTGVLKKRDTGTGSSNGGTSTGAASPVTGPQTPESGRAAKKVRIEEPDPAARDEEESEEDDVEFEDV